MSGRRFQGVTPTRPAPQTDRDGSPVTSQLKPNGTPLGVLPLVGRAAELQTLLRALDGAERGLSSTIFLAGDGGIGKTRLAETVVADAARRGWSTAVGRAYPVNPQRLRERIEDRHPRIQRRVRILKDHLHIAP